MSAGRALAASTGGVLALAVGALTIGCGGTEELPDARIAFLSARGGSDEIYVMDASGSELVRITTGNTLCCDRPHSWSPDGSQLAFSTILGEADAVFVVDADGSNLTKLADAVFPGPPAWSPDGTRIAFDASIDQQASKLSLYVVDFDGSGARPLTDDSRDNFDPFWSPDGSRIGYLSCRDFVDDCQAEIRVMNADGSGLVILVDDDPHIDQPAWSPDGSLIAYAGCRDEDCLGDIFLIRADGSGRTRLTANPLGIEFGDFGPVWSPDGSKVAFICDTTEGTSICVVNSDGSDRTQLTSSGSWLDFDPSWSPDGKWIVFSSDRAESEGSFLGDDIYIVGVDGSGFARLTKDPADDSSPEWAPR